MPELFRKTGGIQQFSRHLIAACDEIIGSPVAIVSRNDRRADLPGTFSVGRQVHCCGSLPARLRPFGVVAATLRYRNARILTTHPRFAAWLALLQRGRCGRYATVVHGIDVWGEWKPAFRTGMIGAQRIFAVSNFTRDAVRSHLGNTSQPLDTFPNTIDATRFFPKPRNPDVRKRLGIPDDARVMLTVARLEKTELQKGYHRVLEAMPGLSRDHQNLFWVVAGNGDDRNDLRNEATRLGVVDRCRFPGFVPEADLPDLYRASDFFVLPSRKEGFGIVFLEALASGIPVIAGNRDGSVDAVDHGRLGLLIDPEDSNELVAAIQSAVTGNLPQRLRDPDYLHRECVALFGFATFRDRLKNALTQMEWIEGEVGVPRGGTTSAMVRARHDIGSEAATQAARSGQLPVSSASIHATELI